MFEAQRLRELREERGWSQEDLGREIGVTGAAVGMWEQGRRSPDSATLVRLATRFGVTTDYLLGRQAQREPTYSADSFIPRQRTVKIPILGTIPAGEFRLTAADIEGWEDVPEEQVRNGEYFYLRVQGDCMAPLIQEGYMVLIRMQPTVDDGELAVVVIGEEDAGLKRVRHVGRQVILYADNPSYVPIPLAAQNVRIIGKVVEVKFQPN